MPGFGRHQNAIIIFLGTAATGILYGLLAEPLGYRPEWAGVTMLVALGASLGIMFFFLHTEHGE